MKPIRKSQEVKQGSIIGFSQGLVGSIIDYEKLYNILVELCNTLDSQKFREEIKGLTTNSNKLEEIIFNKEFPFYPLEYAREFDYNMNQFLLSSKAMDSDNKKFIERYLDISEYIKKENKNFVDYYERLTNYKGRDKASFVRTFPLYCVGEDNLGLEYPSDATNFYDNIKPLLLYKYPALEINLEDFTVVETLGGFSSGNFIFNRGGRAETIEFYHLIFPYMFHITEGGFELILYKGQIHSLLGGYVTGYNFNLDSKIVKKYNSILEKFAPNQKKIESFDDLVEVYIEFYKMFLFKFFMNTTYKPFSKVY